MLWLGTDSHLQHVGACVKSVPGKLDLGIPEACWFEACRFAVDVVLTWLGGLFLRSESVPPGRVFHWIPAFAGQIGRIADLHSVAARRVASKDGRNEWTVGGCVFRLKTGV